MNDDSEGFIPQLLDERQLDLLAWTTVRGEAFVTVNKDLANIAFRTEIHNLLAFVPSTVGAVYAWMDDRKGWAYDASIGYKRVPLFTSMYVLHKAQLEVFKSEFEYFKSIRPIMTVPNASSYT